MKFQWHTLERRAVHSQEVIRNSVPRTLLIYVPVHWNLLLSVYPWESNSGKLMCANQTHKRLIYKLKNHFLICHGNATQFKNQKNSADVSEFLLTLSSGTARNSQVKNTWSSMGSESGERLGQQYIQVRLMSDR